MPISKKRLVLVWRDTLRQCKELYSDTPASEVIDTSVFPPLETIEQRYSECLVKVVNMDTFTAAQKMIGGGLSPLVLNMASDYCPGGGVRKGSRAQEECLFRCSNYTTTLDKSLLPRDTYPLGSLDMIYSSEVTVFKTWRYESLEVPFKVSCIACAGMRKPELNDDDTDYLYQNDYDLMCEKIEGIFRIAYEKGHNSLLLGAIGCGAFRNPPRVVASIFAEKVEKWKPAFRSIGFAVLAHGACENFEVFKEVLTP